MTARDPGGHDPSRRRLLLGAIGAVGAVAAAPTVLRALRAFEQERARVTTLRAPSYDVDLAELLFRGLSDHRTRGRNGPAASAPGRPAS